MKFWGLVRHDPTKTWTKPCVLTEEVRQSGKEARVRDAVIALTLPREVSIASRSIWILQTNLVVHLSANLRCLFHTDRALHQGGLQRVSSPVKQIKAAKPLKLIFFNSSHRDMTIPASFPFLRLSIMGEYKGCLHGTSAVKIDPVLRKKALRWGRKILKGTFFAYKLATLTIS